MTMFKAPKHVPKWAIYAAGGAAVAGGLVALKNRNTVAPADTTAESDGTGVVGYTDAQNMPGIIVAPSQPVTQPLDDGSNMLGSMYLGALGDLFAGLSNQNSELLSAVLSTGGGAGSTGSTANTGGTVDTNPAPAPVSTPTPTAPAQVQAPADAPAANPCIGYTAGGSAGACHPAGAICHQQLKCDSNSNGHYCTHKFKFPDGHAACFNNYSSGRYAGKCVGPFGCP